MRVVACLVTTPGRTIDWELFRTIPDEWGYVVWINGQSVSGAGPLRADTPPPFHRRPVDDRKVFGRFEAVRIAQEELDADLVVVQDDDCVVDLRALVDRHEPGRLVANMPQSRWADYRDSTLIGWGAVFEPDLAWQAFLRWQDAGEAVDDDRFLRCCDVVFSALTPRTVIDLGFSHLPFAHDPDRMHKQPGHKAERDEVLRLARRVRSRGAADDDRRVP